MAKIVKFLGRASKPEATLLLEGMAPWKPGETRLFDDSYASRFGFESGDDYAEFFTNVYQPLFEMTDAPVEKQEDEELDTENTENTENNSEENVGLLPDSGE